MKNIDNYDINTLIKTKPASVSQIEFFDSIPSTNTYLKENYPTLDSGHIVIANQQTAGRGRLNHRFESKADVGLYLSILLKPKDFTSNNLTTILSCVALHRTIRACYGVASDIKWINDLYLNHKKIAGILVENIIQSNGNMQAVIIGIGINLHPQSFSPEWNNTLTSIENESYPFCSRTLFVQTLLEHFFMLYHQSSSKSVLDEYRRYCHSLHQEIYMDQEYLGISVAIDDDGGLVIEKNGSLVTIRSGSIKY